MLRGRWRRLRYRRWRWRRCLWKRLVGVALWSIGHCVTHCVAPVRRLVQRKLRCFSGGEHCGKLEPAKSLHCAQVLYYTSVTAGVSQNKSSACYGPQWSGRSQHVDGRTSPLVPANERHHLSFSAHYSLPISLALMTIWDRSAHTGVGRYVMSVTIHKIQKWNIIYTKFVDKDWYGLYINYV